MRRILAGFLLSLLASSALADDRVRHEVEAGEYLGLIAIRYGVTVEQLESWNELDSDRIRIGQSLIVSPEAPVEEARDEWETTYVVVRGDHLARIAALVGTTRESLERANPSLGSPRLRPGQTLRIVGATRIVDHLTRRGETLARLASRYEVRHRDLLVWNPALRRRGLETGMTVRVYTDVRMSRSESVGAPNEGTLADGEALPAHRAYVIRNPDHSFGTHETVQWIVEAFDTALDADPNMPRLRVHDISTREGGRLSGHRSHQSGRDVDIAYFRTRCRANEPCFMSRTGVEDLDVAHTWRIFRYWLERDLATAIFVDYALQASLYDYAREHGATRDELSRWFQYPRSSTTPVGVVRHFRGHADHFHVRFACPRGDDSCTEAVRREREPEHEAEQEDEPGRQDDRRNDRATERATDRASDRATERTTERASDRATEESPARAVSDAPADSE